MIYMYVKSCVKEERNPAIKYQITTLSLRLLFYFQPDKNALVVANLVFIN